MEKHYHAIVVGAGIAGLTSATYLSKAGYRTLLLEKNAQCGGLLGSFMFNGHQVDQGARGIIDSGIFKPMMEQLDLDIELLPNPIRLTIGDHSVDFKDRSSLNDYEELLKKLYPQNQQDITQIVGEIKKIMQYMDVLYGIKNPLFLSKPYDYAYLGKTLLPWMFKFLINSTKAMKLLEPINEYLRKFTDNESLIHIITQHFFTDTPTFFALSYFTLYTEYLYPKGSTQVIIDQMMDIINQNHGTIINDQQVDQIDVAKKEVKTKEGLQYRYDQLIWAADTNVLYQCLQTNQIKHAQIKQRVIQKKEFLSDKKGADSVLSLYIISDRPSEYFQSICGPHAFYTYSSDGLSNDSMSELINENNTFTTDQKSLYDWLEKYIEKNTFEISIPSLRDSTLSPPGETALIVSILFDYQLTKHIEQLGIMEDFKSWMTHKILSHLAHYFPDFSESVTNTFMITPLAIAKQSNNTEGSLSGWSFSNHPFPVEHKFLKVSKSVLTPIKTIKQAGQWTFNPAGLPVSIMTGKLAADAVIKDLKKQKEKHDG